MRRKRRVQVVRRRAQWVIPALTASRTRSKGFRVPQRRLLRVRIIRAAPAHNTSPASRLLQARIIRWAPARNMSLGSVRFRLAHQGTEAALNKLLT